mmetsp:Transcript_4559/g.11895  ORF Transcript_4559/g.11895 Transcript_4559/m.11895 type:complete len:287 (+) Transcript_4559:1129-1989(+)
MNSLFARVSRTREEIERILDDDEDMYNMYVGRKPGTPGKLESIQSEESLDMSAAAASPAVGTPGHRQQHFHTKFGSVHSLHGSFPSPSFNEVWMQKKGGVDEVEAVEAFLEVYFMKTDFLMKRLSILKEKVDDYEDLINIDLDSRRNELFKVDILLTCGTMSMALISAIAGIFGMNLHSGGEAEYEGEDKSHIYFILTSIIASGACVLLFVGLVWYLKYKRLMFVPEPKIVSSTIDRSMYLGVDMGKSSAHNSFKEGDGIRKKSRHYTGGGPMASRARTFQMSSYY